MNEFDKFIRTKIKEEDRDVPENVDKKVCQALQNLPERDLQTPHARIVLSKAAAIAASFLFASLIVLPNISTVYAQALERIPLISAIVKVVTIRNYFYTDDHHEMNIYVPKVESDSSSANAYINKDVEELTQMLVKRFQEELSDIGSQGYSSVYVNYEVMTNTARWFTLKLQVYEAAGSSNTYYKYYHIDKSNGDIVQLGDLAVDSAFFAVIEDELLRQMQQQMEDNPDIIYWVDNPYFHIDFSDLESDHNFYWNEQGELVIVFDKYEVGPGSMGTPEFAIKKDYISDFLKPEYQNLNG